MSCGSSRFSKTLWALGSNRDVHILTDILALSHDPSVDDILHECSNTLESLDTGKWEMRRKVLKCVGLNLPQLAKDRSSLGKYLEILRDSLAQSATSFQSSQLAPGHVFENVTQGPDSTLIVKAADPTTARNISVGAGASVFLGTYP